MSHSNTPPVKNQAPLTARSSSVYCVYWWPITRLQNSTPKLAGQKTESISQEAIYHGTLVACQDFLKIPSIWETALEIEQRCFSKVILESSVTPNTTRSSDLFSTVPTIVNGGNSGCIVRDLESIIVLVLLTFSFIVQRSHLQDHGSGTLLLQLWRLGMAQHPSKWSHQHYRSAYFPKWKKAPKCRRNNNGPKTQSFLQRPA